MGSSSTGHLKRLRNPKRKAPLDERRLEVIRKRIAEHFYDRNDVQQSIAEKVAGCLVDDKKDDEEF